MNKFKPSRYNGFKRPLSSSTESFQTYLNFLPSHVRHHSVPVTLSTMLKSYRIPSDPSSYPSLLKACTSLAVYPLGLSIHQCAIVNGFAVDSYIASSLITFYAKSGNVDSARKVFEGMTDRNVVPCTAIIGCYSRAGDVVESFSLFSNMRRQGTEPSSVTLLEITQGNLELIQVKLLHSCALMYGFESDRVLVNSLVNAYSKCGNIEDAEALFLLMDQRDIVSWNILISAYAQNGKVDVILQLLKRMGVEGNEPDQQTFGSLVSATALWSNLRLAKLVHGKILRASIYIDAHLQTSLTVMYLKCGSVKDALEIFQHAPERDVVQWTALISGLVQNECADKAMMVFQSMLEAGECPSSATLASVLAACAQLGSYWLGTSVHGFLVRQRVPVDIAVQNSLVNMYAKCGHVNQSEAIFNHIQEKDVVSWNAIIVGYAQNGYVSNALSYFRAMRISCRTPDSITVVSLLQACASIGALHQGKWMHSYIIRSCLGSFIMVNTALVDMYSKCGNMAYAQNCFNHMSEHDLFSWSTIITGYGSHGKGEIAIRMYSEFLKCGFRPNDVVFLSVLSACSHNGLVDQGLSLYSSMIEEYKIAPRLEHRACIIDLLCRAGQVNEAYNFYRENSTEPEVHALGMLLDACRTHGHEELSDKVATEMVKLRPEDAGHYIQLAHSYAATSRWNNVGEALITMRSLSLTKQPGWSFIELCGNITTFFRDHSSHPQYEEIQRVLKIMRWEMERFDIDVNAIK